MMMRKDHFTFKWDGIEYRIQFRHAILAQLFVVTKEGLVLREQTMSIYNPNDRGIAPFNMIVGARLALRRLIDGIRHGQPNEPWYMIWKLFRRRVIAGETREATSATQSARAISNTTLISTVKATRIGAFKKQIKGLLRG